MHLSLRPMLEPAPRVLAVRLVPAEWDPDFDTMTSCSHEEILFA